MELLGQGGGNGEHAAFPVERKSHVGGDELTLDHYGGGFAVGSLDLGYVVGQILVGLAGGSLLGIRGRLGSRGICGFGGIRGDFRGSRRVVQAVIRVRTASSRAITPRICFMVLY